MPLVKLNKVVNFVPNQNEMNILRIVGVFGYIDKFFVDYWIAPNKTYRLKSYRLALLEKFNYLSSFHGFVPNELTYAMNRPYFLYSLAIEGTRFVESCFSIKLDKRKKDEDVPLLAHNTMLARCTMEICQSLIQEGFYISDIYNESGPQYDRTDIRPDATILFHTKEYKYGLIFIEMERNVRSQNIISTKLLRYSRAIENGLFERGFDQKIYTYRIIYVASSTPIAKDLAKKILEAKKPTLPVLLSSYKNICDNHENTEYTLMNGWNKMMKITDPLPRD